MSKKEENILKNFVLIRIRRFLKPMSFVGDFPPAQPQPVILLPLSGRDKLSKAKLCDRLCGLVVRVLATYPGVPGSIPGHYQTKKSSGSGTGFTQPREYN
jgi:hypothetical protein